ncbi:MAG: hypothetical protein D4R64_05785 [Porphyromonadaceae bacterium]|nr:MAG: hypothetical protein D4R64_05785 [Porphyromonadaceae bacterium]
MKKMFLFIPAFCIAILLIGTESASGQIVDLSKAEILASSKINSPVRETAIRVLQEEVAQRTSINLQLTSKWEKAAIIALATIKDIEINGLAVPKRTGENLPETKAEGFRIYLDKSNGKEILWLIGADDRGVVFAVGQFLRTAELSRNKISFNKINEIATSPVYSIRGHQLGYRNTANSWDAWTVSQFDKYIRELALFGSNCIENIPFQDSPPGPNMKVPRDEMNSKMSEICNQYGLDYWVWTPADVDLADQAKFKAEVEKHAGLYKNCPRLDGERIEPTIYNKGLEEFKEFPLSQKYVSDGRIEVSFDQPEESQLNWRQQSKVCDSWLLKK